MYTMQSNSNKDKNNSSAAAAAAAKAQAALKAQIQFELNNKRQCGYKLYECTLLSLDGYSYCLRHILCDKNAPYKQCSFVYSNNGKRCFLPAPKTEKKEFFCNEHALKAHLHRAKQGTKAPPPRTAETLLNSLTHYVKKPRCRNISGNSQYSDEGGRNTPEDVEPKVTKSFDPFSDIDTSQVNSSCNNVLDMCSESESDVEAATYSSVWQDAQADSSENESIDSEQEDLLKHTNIYSAEEITLVTKEKLIRLQSLYIEQYNHLQHMLKEKRRKYLQALKREKETCCSISNQARDNPKEQRMYKKLKAYNQYHKKIGTEAILRKRLNEMRMKVTDGVHHKPQSYQTKCAFTEGGVKCIEKALPVARHCRKHILEDPNQVLFRACGRKRSDVECSTPVEAIFDDQTCVLHRDIPPIRSYSQLRKDSESDYDDAYEHNNVNVKTEVIDYSNPTSVLINNFINDHSDVNMEENEMDMALINDMKMEMYDNPHINEIHLDANEVSEGPLPLQAAQIRKNDVTKHTELNTNPVSVK